MLSLLTGRPVCLLGVVSWSGPVDTAILDKPSWAQLSLADSLVTAILGRLCGHCYPGYGPPDTAVLGSTSGTAIMGRFSWAWLFWAGPLDIAVLDRFLWTLLS